VVDKRKWRERLISQRVHDGESDHHLREDRSSGTRWEKDVPASPSTATRYGRHSPGGEKRPVSAETIDHIVDTRGASSESSLTRSGEQRVGDLIINELKSVDPGGIYKFALYIRTSRRGEL
jgi:hypothetical protein